MAGRSSRSGPAPQRAHLRCGGFLLIVALMSSFFFAEHALLWRTAHSPSTSLSRDPAAIRRSMVGNATAASERWQQSGNTLLYEQPPAREALESSALPGACRVQYSIFATPKNPKRLDPPSAQTDALHSWLQLQPPPERIIFLLSPYQRVRDFDALLDVDRARVTAYMLERAEQRSGLPYFDELLLRSASVEVATGGRCGRGDTVCGRNHVAVMVNADIVLHQGVVESLCATQEMTQQGDGDFLVVATRWELAADDEHAAAAVRLDGERAVREHAVLSETGGIDLWAYPIGGPHRNRYTVPARAAVPPMVRGRSRCDNWLVSTARANGVLVVDATPVAFLVHRTHGYGFLSSNGSATRSVWITPQSAESSRFNHYLSDRYGELVNGGGTALDANVTLVAQRDCFATMRAHDPLVSFPHLTRPCTFPLAVGNASRRLPYYEHLAPLSPASVGDGGVACSLCAVPTRSVVMCAAVAERARSPAGKAAGFGMCYATLVPLSVRVGTRQHDVQSYAAAAPLVGRELFQQLLFSRVTEPTESSAYSAYAAAVHNTVIVLVASASHLPMLRNMMCRLQRLGIAGRAVVVPLDTPSWQLCRKMGWLAVDPLMYYGSDNAYVRKMSEGDERPALRSLLDTTTDGFGGGSEPPYAPERFTLALPCRDALVHLRVDPNFESTFGERLYSCLAKVKVLAVASVLAATPFSVLLLDVDVMLRRDPFEWLLEAEARYSDADVLVQSDRPLRVARNEWYGGGCLNSGVLWLRNNPLVLRVYRELAQSMVDKSVADRSFKSPFGVAGDQPFVAEAFCGARRDSEWRIGEWRCRRPDTHLITQFVEDYEWMNGIVWQTAYGVTMLQDLEAEHASGYEQLPALRSNFSSAGVLVHFNWMVGVRRKEMAMRRAGGWALDESARCTCA